MEKTNDQKTLAIIIYGQNLIDSETIGKLITVITEHFNSTFLDQKKSVLSSGDVNIAQISATVYNYLYCVTILGSFCLPDSDSTFLKNILAKFLKTNDEDIYFDITACYK